MMMVPMNVIVVLIIFYSNIVGDGNEKGKIFWY